MEATKEKLTIIFKTINLLIEKSTMLDNIIGILFMSEIKRIIENKGYNVYKCTVNGIFNAENEKAGIKNIKIILESKNSNYENKTEENNENLIKVENVENIKIGINNTNEEVEKITNKDIKDLKKYLSDHYEIEQKILDIQVR